jgi:hypothetical protein
VLAAPGGIDIARARGCKDKRKRYHVSVADVRLGSVFGPKNPNPEPDLGFGSGNVCEPRTRPRSGSFGVRNIFEPKKDSHALEVDFGQQTFHTLYKVCFLSIQDIIMISGCVRTFQQQIQESFSCFDGKSMTQFTGQLNFYRYQNCSCVI